MRQRWKHVVLAIAAVTGAAGREAVAAICFPDAYGVPGPTWESPPDWWSAGATWTGSSTTSWLEDPRWQGAFGDRIIPNEQFQVVVENSGGVQYLVMSWQVIGDPTNTSGGDRLYFGVWDDASGTGNVYRLRRAPFTATSADGASFSASDGQGFASSGALGSVTWSATSTGSTFPTWLTNDARVDVVCTTATLPVCDTWAFRVRAKIDPAASTSATPPTGIKISTGTPPTFRFYYEVQDSGAIGTAKYSFPRGLTRPASETGTPTFPDPNSWQQAQLGSSSSCDGDIKFNADDIWVNSTGSTLLNLTTQNAFHATPANNTGAAVANSTLTARFRIANWGSAGFSSPEWTTVCNTPPSGTSIANGNPFNLTCNWTAPSPCPYEPASTTGCTGMSPGTKDPHQCVLANLDILTGPHHYTFATQSAYKNMDFDVNSTLVRHAVIDIRGLGPMPGGAANRDVYLYIHTNNLPEKIDDEPPATDKQAAGRAIILPARQRFKQLELPAKGAIGTKESARIQAALLARKLTLAQVEQIMPTYTVYVWHDTGSTLPTAAGPSKILEAQPSFGLFLAHDGALEGWKHELTAEGGVLVGPNLYKFSPPNDTTFPVTITIAPLTCTGPLCVLPTWIWILLALLVLLLILYLSFRKRQPAPPAPAP